MSNLWVILPRELDVHSVIVIPLDYLSTHAVSNSDDGVNAPRKHQCQIDGEILHMYDLTEIGMVNA